MLRFGRDFNFDNSKTSADPSRNCSGKPASISMSRLERPICREMFSLGMIFELSNNSTVRLSKRGFSGSRASSPGSVFTPQRADLLLNSDNLSSSVIISNDSKRIIIAATETPQRCFNSSRLSNVTGRRTSVEKLSAGKRNAPANRCACLSSSLCFWGSVTLEMRLCKTKWPNSCAASKRLRNPLSLSDANNTIGRFSSGLHAESPSICAMPVSSRTRIIPAFSNANATSGIGPEPKRQSSLHSCAAASMSPESISIGSVNSRSGNLTSGKSTNSSRTRESS